MNPKCHCSITLQFIGLSSPLKSIAAPLEEALSRSLLHCKDHWTIDRVVEKLILTQLLQGLEAQTRARDGKLFRACDPCSGLNLTIALTAQLYLQFQEEWTAPKAH